MMDKNAAELKIDQAAFLQNLKSTTQIEHQQLEAVALSRSSKERLPVIDIFSEAGFVALDEIANDKNGFYKIVFKDNGIGFEQEYASQIFKLFTKLHSVSQYDGSGIRLALCKKIMQRHNGLIDAEGQLNQEAKFNLFFPEKR